MNESMPTTNWHRQTLLQDFKALFADASLSRLERMERIYTQDVEFRDPLQSALGILALKRHMKTLCARYDNIRFEYIDEQSGDHWASITWYMHFSHPVRTGNKPIRVRGMTQLRFTDRIYYHENFYDAGALIYQHVPLLGAIVRFIKRRIGH